VQLVLSDAPINLVEEGFDLGIWFGGLPNSRLRARKLQDNRRFLCASPSYLARKGVPKTLADLAGHNCIILRQDNASYDLWKFQRGQHSETVRVHGTLSSNDGEIALKWVLDGHGIMLRSEWDIARHIRANRLCLVLPHYAQVDADIYAVYPERHNVSAKVRLFIDYLHKQLQGRGEEGGPG
jgi:DNA-binding transcriptional LysR family regulator